MDDTSRPGYKVFLGSLDGIRTGGTIAVEMRVDPRPGSQVIDDVAAILQTFDQLAQTGALAGDQLDPWDSGIDSVELTTGPLIWWRMHGCRLDERAMMLLAHWLQAVRDRGDIVSVAIGSEPFEDLAQVPWNPVYPALHCPPGFSIEQSDGLSGEVRILVEMDRPWDDDETEALDNQLATCATAISMGAYVVAPVEWTDGDCLFEPELERLDAETVAFHITRFRAHPAAIDALLNACIACIAEFGMTCSLVVE